VIYPDKIRPLSREEKSEIDNIFKNKFDWRSIFSIVDSIGSSLNSNSDKFDKGGLLERAAARYSTGHINRVENLHGRDHLMDLSSGRLVKVEQKGLNYAFFQERSSNLKPEVATVTLKNHRGKTKIKLIEDHINFDVLLVLDTGNPKTYAVGYIYATDVYEHLVNIRKTDSKATVDLKKLPMDKINFVYRYNDTKSDFYPTSIDYKKQKELLQDSFVASICPAA